MNDLSLPRIAIVDDDINLQKTLTDILTIRGYSPVVYKSGQAALSQIPQNNIAVALLDLRLSDVSGLDVLRGVRENSPATECILLTGHASQNSAIEAINRGAYSYIQKPFDVDQLLLTIQRAVEKSAADKAVRESEARFRALVEHSTDVISLIDAQGTVLFHSSPFTALTGYTPQERLGKNFSEHIAPEDRQQAQGFLAKLAHNPGLIVPASFRIPRRDGEYIWIEGTGVNMLQEPAVQAIVLNYRNITERKQSEEALISAHSKLRMLFDNLDEVFFSVDTLQFKILEMSPACEKIYGRSAADFFANPRLWTEAIHPDDQNQMQTDNAVLYTGQPLHQEYRILRPGGEIRWVEAKTKPVLDGTGRLVRFDGVLSDITERKRAEEALRESEARYRRIVDTANEGIWTIDESLHTTYVNARIAEMMGYEPKEMLGLHLQSFINFEDMADYERRMIAFRQGGASQYEMCLIRKDGGLIWVHVNASPMKDEEGFFRGSFGMLTDITERKQAEETIKRRAAQLAILNDIASSFTAEMDIQVILEATAQSVQQSFNYHHVGLFLFDPITQQLHLRAKAGAFAALFPPDHRLKTGEGMVGWVYRNGKSLLASDVSTENRYVNVYPDTLPTQSELSIPIQGTGRIFGVVDVQSPVANAFDENDVLALETLGRQIAIAIENAQLYENAKNRLEELNRLARISAALRMARNRSQMFPILLQQIMSMLQADGAAFAYRDRNTGETIFENGVGSLGEYNHLRLPAGDGVVDEVLYSGEMYLSQEIETGKYLISPEMTILPNQAMAFVPLNTLNQVIGVILIISQNRITPAQSNLLKSIADIGANAIERAALYEETVRYAAELERRVEERTAELRRANQELARAARLKDEFMASMSHELRTPLTGVLNLSEALQEQVYGELNEKQRATLHTIEDSGRHLLSLINDILDLSKIEAGQLTLQIGVFSVNDVCQGSLQMVKGLAQTKNQRIQYSIEPPTIILYADLRRLKQMIVNLLSNAVKFTPQGGQVGLEVRADPQALQVSFTVWDTGIGIAPQDLPRLFRPFTQLDSSLSRQHAGTGLGLALVQRMADLHGGRVHVESHPGQGSRFTIVLPWLDHEPEEQPAAPAHPTAPLLLLDSNPATVGKPVILVADDNEINVTAYRDYLENKGYAVLTAAGALEAIALAEESHPQVILMDIQMPGIDGLEATRTLRAHPDPRVASIPIIAVTALAMSGDRERCLQAGANDYLSKPVSLRGLLEAIEKYL